MTYLIAQISGCLLLAALSGWFIGWSWRGFRDQDKIEDMRHTLRATDDIKDRELTAAYRRADSLQSEVDVARRRLEDPRRHGRDRNEITPRDKLSTPAPPISPPPTAVGTRAADDKVAMEREAKVALHAKTAAVLSLQGEIRTLRAEIGSRAERIARLESRVIELEPLEARLAEREKHLQKLREERDAAAERRAIDRADAQGAAAKVESMRSDILDRDRRLNELRIRYNDALASVQSARESTAPIRRASPAATPGAAETAAATTGAAETAAELVTLRQRLADKRQEIARLESRVIELEPLRARLAACQRRIAELQQESSQADELRRLLQRQIERNRKQEAVHRSVVDDLKSQATTPPIADQGLAMRQQEEAAAVEKRWRQRLRERDAQLEALQQRVDELETIAADDTAAARPTDVLTDPLLPAERTGGGDIERYRGRLGRLQTTAAGGDDDLQQIHGIGPILESRLQALGITSLAQIGAWQDGEIDLIARRLRISPARIRRDDWVGSARAHGLGHDQE